VARATVVGETERLRLEAWSGLEASELATIGTPNVVRYLGGTPWTVETARDSIALWREIDRRLGITTWAVRLRESSELIGTCGFAGTNMPWLRFDAVIEIGWTLGERWWGQGLASEAASAALSVGLARYPRDRFLSKCHVENDASERVMHRIGMVRVGVVQGAFPAATVVCRLP
jgi:RimJ/RimL family protein N-acetyltransferase